MQFIMIIIKPHSKQFTPQ